MLEKRVRIINTDAIMIKQSIEREIQEEDKHSIEREVQEEEQQEPRKITYERKYTGSQASNPDI
jgi:hypothetical protein